MTGRSHEVDAEREGPGCACDQGPSIGARIGSHFDSKVTRVGPDARSSLHATSKSLLGLLGDPTDRTVLELGCGRGGLMVELLREGAAGASGVELSSASVDLARDRFAALGLADKVTLTVGDGAEAVLDRHDWVVLDRVICCYPDADKLLANSIPAARHRYAFSVPNSRGWRGLAARAGRRLDNGVERIARAPVRDLRPRPGPDRADASIGRLRALRRRDAWALVRGRLRAGLTVRSVRSGAPPSQRAALTSPADPPRPTPRSRLRCRWPG